MRDLHPTRKAETRFGLLVNDLASACGDIRLLEYEMAFLDKLAGVKVTYSLGRKAAVKSRRIFRKERKSIKAGVVSKVGGPLTYAATHLESFLYFIMGALDILASITVCFYPKHSKALSTYAYFKDQMVKTFLKHPNIGPEYSALLSESRQWIEDVANNRDGLAHKASAFLAFEKDGSVVFERRKPFDDRDPARKKEFQDLTKYLDGTVENLYSFVDAYVAVHRKMVKQSDRTRMMLKALEKGLVKEYTP
jgi:hypothetical protein